MVFIDTGAGISKNVLFFNIAASERLVVANNEPTSITDAYALIKVLATQHNERRFKLLVNGLSEPREAEAVYRTLLKVAERFLGRDISLEYLGYIPHDDSVSKAVLKQQPVLTLYPKSRVARSFTQMAQKLWEMPAPEESDGNIKFFWRRLLQYQL